MKEYYSKKPPKSTVTRRLVIYLIFCVIIYFLSGNFSNIPLAIWILLSLITIFCFYGIVKALQNKPTLILDKSGIMHSSTLNCCGRIKWIILVELKFVKDSI